MRRLAYPYGRFLIENTSLETLGMEAKHFLEHQGFSVIKFDEKNEDIGILVVGVNKTILEYIKQKKPMGRLQEYFLEVTSLFSMDFAPLRDIDEASQRIGIEIYLWPSKEKVLMEVFVLPYMEMLNKAEVCRFIKNPQEDITDWYLSEEVWENIKPELKKTFQAKQVFTRPR